MHDDDDPQEPAPTSEGPVGELDARPPLSDAAKRALAEAEERRRMAQAERAGQPVEIGGRGGPEPVRYGDWEKGGIAWDF
ncbi:MAG: DUF1674 domain-containing protein [Hyphomicrobiaceae bacterium]|nr:DUF1674 domain-containing protein [Hyphomicrobiaceae bacterium]